MFINQSITTYSKTACAWLSCRFTSRKDTSGFAVIYLFPTRMAVYFICLFKERH